MRAPCSRPCASSSTLAAYASHSTPRLVLDTDSMRLVLDTNVWLDWVVFDDPSIAPIKAAVEGKRAEVFIDAACEAELERALAYDFGRKRTLAAAGRDACLAECRRVAQRIHAAVPEGERALLPACRD